MKKVTYTISLALALVMLISCDNTSNTSETPEILTGDAKTYTLYQASDYNIQGEVTFSELKTGFSQVIIQITPTEKELLHPVHIHFSSIEMNGGIAVVLNPIDGETGISTTELKEFEDGTSVKYQDLVNMDISLKIHLSSTPPDYSTILVGGNIGSAQLNENPLGRREITTCK